MLRAMASAFLVLFAFGAICLRPAEKPAAPWVYLPQGWNEKQRQEFYSTPQGSYLIPYKWFLHLEQAGSNQPFRADANMERFRYLPNPPHPGDNLDGLPIGFVKESVPASAVSDKLSAALLRPLGADSASYPKPKAWLGLTCAACHTSQIECKGKRIRIDGGPALADFNSFVRALGSAVDATLENDDKFCRFASKILGSDDNAEARKGLHHQLDAYNKVFRAYADRNHPPFAWGFGRMDAFGLIMNEVFGTDLQVPANYRPPDAPVSYPDLWYTPQLAWVQWNGSAANPFGRNLGEVMGVFGQVAVTDGFASSLRGKDLYALEQLVAQLKPPAWDEKLLGKIDSEKAKQGAALYRTACAGCHAVKPYPRTPPDANAYKKTFIEVQMVPLDDIGTDRKMATNFAGRTALRGPLGDPSDVPTDALSLLLEVVQHVVARQFKDLGLTPQQQQEYSGYRIPGKPFKLLGYRARPLTGIWATAPYLHNGSVPNLYQLLLPPGQRVRTFYVGSRQFDPKHVGLATDKAPGAFLFDTGLPGNSNAGHRYGTNLTDDERWALIEYLKTF